MTYLRPAELATLRALSSAFVPDADADRVASTAAEALARAVDPAQLTQLRLVLRLLEQPLANVATGAGFAAFSRMEQPARERLILRWTRSPLVLRRSGMHAFRKLLSFIAYADPGTPDAPNPLLRSIGYYPDDPPVTSEPAAIRPIAVDRRASGAGDQGARFEADVVVIGSGAGGGVVAAELAKAGRRVLVIEAGPFVDEATMPRDELDAYGRLFLNYGLNASWAGSITMLAGSTVGGGTVVNWMTCLDAPVDVREEWAREHGLDGVEGSEWSSDAEIIDRELGLAPSAVIPPKDELIRRGAAELGWEAGVITRNARDCGDCGSCPFGCRRGTKQSGIRAHLAEAVRNGAQVLDRARVRSVVLPGSPSGGVAGVAGTLGPPDGGADGDDRRPFAASAPQVVLAAGALRSPAILQASGLEHGSIGRHLRIHPTSIVGVLHDEPVDMWRGTMQAVRSLEFGRDEPDHRRYVIESGSGHPGLLAFMLPWEGASEHRALMQRARHFSPLLGVSRDGGEGRTRLTRVGRVRVDYVLDELGQATARHALVAMARLARAGGAREILALGTPLARHRVEAADEAARFARFEQALRSMDFGAHRGTIASAHQMGTVRMGGDPATHPADPRGRVRADSRGSIVRRLYVADGSGVNPMLSIMAMARRVSRTVLAEGRAG